MSLNNLLLCLHIYKGTDVMMPVQPQLNRYGIALSR